MSAPGKPSRPDTVLRNGKHGLQRHRFRRRRWCEAVQAAFLDALVASCNVRWACEQAGISDSLAYDRRRADPAFAAAWQAALEQGYELLEQELLRSALQPTLPPGRRAEPTRFPDMTAAEAMHLLKLHRAAVHGGRPQRYGWRETPKTLEELRDRLLRKFEVVEAARLKRLSGGDAQP